MTKKLLGWASFWKLPDGSYFLSDSHPNLKAAKDAYGRSEIDGYIDLSLIPEAAIHLVGEKTASPPADSSSPTPALL